MHNIMVNKLLLYVQIVHIFTDTPIFIKVNARIPLFFHRKNFAPPTHTMSISDHNISVLVTKHLEKNMLLPRFWQTNIGFHSFLNAEMIKLLILIFVSYAIAILLLEHICTIHGKRNTTYKANCDYSTFGNSITGEQRNVTTN